MLDFTRVLMNSDFSRDLKVVFSGRFLVRFRST